MKKSETKILIVEDDETLGRALTETIRRAGFQALNVTNPDEALTHVRTGEYPMVLIDCLLPRGNGVELAGQMREIIGDDLRILLTSGIYRDKTFAKDAQFKVKASAFLLKPFDTEKLLEEIHSAFGTELEPDLPPLLETLTLANVPIALRQKAVEKSEGLHGFDLPQIYSLIFGSNLSGTLNIISSEGGVSALTFHEGRLVNVVLNDKTSYFGVLLVEMGYTSSEEVEDGLAMPKDVPLGERLVESLSLSPHAIRVVRVEQMLIRLSKTVSDSFIDINFMPAQPDLSDVFIDRDQYSLILWDWICSKIPVDWYKNFYDRWMEYPVVLHDEHTIHRRVAALPGLHQQVKILSNQSSNRTLSELVESDEAGLLPVIHFLLLEKLAHFGHKKATASDTNRVLKRLKTVFSEMKNKNHFGVLGLSPKAQDKEVNRSYLELAKVYHPDRLPPTAPKEVRDLTEKIFARISQAHDFLKEPGQREKYVQELERGKAEKALVIENQIEQALNQLHKGQYKQALKVFTDLAKTVQHRGDINIYLAWAKLKYYSGKFSDPKPLNKISDMLNRVPPEDRHSSHYFYAKALLYKESGDFSRAKINFKHALVLDPSFVEARRDLAIVRGEIQRFQATQSDFSTVVNLFLGRKRR